MKSNVLAVSCLLVISLTMPVVEDTPIVLTYGSIVGAPVLLSSPGTSVPVFLSRPRTGAPVLLLNSPTSELAQLSQVMRPAQVIIHDTRLLRIPAVTTGSVRLGNRGLPVLGCNGDGAGCIWEWLLGLFNQICCECPPTLRSARARGTFRPRRVRAVLRCAGMGGGCWWEFLVEQLCGFFGMCPCPPEILHRNLPSRRALSYNN